MTTKKKSSVILMTAILSTSTILSPMAVHAQNPTNEDDFITNQESGQNVDLESIVKLPQDLSGEEGQLLQDITLPEHWSWVNAQDILTKDKAEYPVRILVDDESYDYSNVEGYNPEEHYVELSLAVDVKEKEITVEQTPQFTAKTIKNEVRQVAAPTNVGEIVIDSNNFPDKAFRSYVSAAFDTDGNGSLSIEEIEAVEEIRVSHNGEIEDLTGIEYFTSLWNLQCNGTSITKLDINKNSSLQLLNCSYTYITSLDISNNPGLYVVQCNNTGIKSIYTGSNHNLSNLTCSNTGITSLDLSANIYLNALLIDNIPLAYLKLSSESMFNLSYASLNDLKPIELNVDGNPFKMTDKFPGIDISKIKKQDVKGAVYDEKTGTMSNYTLGTKITYTYDCGQLNDGTPLAINVTLLPSLQSTIAITDNLDKIYDGVSVNEKPTVTQSRSGTVNYTWEEKNSYNRWETITSAPSDAGRYRVTATLVSEGKYAKAIDTKEFIISQAANVWEKDLSIAGWVYGEQANAPFAEAKYEDVVYTYSDSEKGVYNLDVPTDVGTWYVKATVETKNYTRLETIKEFTITKATNVWDTELSIKDWTYGEKPNDPIADAKFGDVVLTYSNSEKGTYTDKVPTDAGTWYVKAFVAGTSNYSGLEAVKEFTISQAVNVWNTELSIKDWAYGEKANDPTADAKYGDVVFTYSDAEKGIYTDKVPTEAGTWYVKVTVAGTSNYTGLEAVKEFTITQATNVWNTELSIDGWVYDEKPNIPVADAKYGDVVFTYSDAEKGIYTDKAPTEAGTWYVKATVAGTSNYSSLEAVKEFTISQAVNVWDTELSIDGWVYDENPNNPTADTKYGDVVFTYSDSKNGVYTDEVPTEAGTWYVKATVAGTSNYSGLEAVKEFTISQAANVWNTELLITGWVYDEKPNNPTADAKYGDVVFTYSDSKNGVYTDEVPTDVGTWYVKATVAGTSNYSGLEVIKEFTITQATNVWNAELSITDWAYGEKANDPTADAKYGDVVFAYSDSKNGVYTNVAPTEAGTWYVKATVAGTSNYAGLEAVKEFTITQATNVWNTELSITDWAYGEKANDPTADAKFGDIVFTYSDSKNGVYTNAAPTEAGTWYVKATVAGTSNYAGLEVIKEFTITQATNVWNTELLITGWAYGEKANDPTADAKFGDIVFTYSDSKNGVYTNAAPTEAGTWYVKATVAGTSNYAGLEAVKEFTISQAVMHGIQNYPSKAGYMMKNQTIQQQMLNTETLYLPIAMQKKESILIKYQWMQEHGM